MDRQLPFIPDPSVLLGTNPCFDVLLAIGNWNGNTQAAQRQNVKDAQNEVSRVSGLGPEALQYIAVNTNNIVQVMRRIVKRSSVLTTAAAKAVRQALRVLEGMRQLLRLYKYSRCVAEPVEAGRQICAFLDEDMAAAQCFGVFRLCGVCTLLRTARGTESTHAAAAIAEAAWQSVAHFRPGGAASNSWAPLARYPEEYSRGLCVGPAEASAFEGPGLRGTDALGLPSPHLSLADILLRMDAAGIQLSRLVINLGANDGSCRDDGSGMHDPANCLVLSGAWGGVLVEGNAEHVHTLRQQHASRDDVAIVSALLDPSNPMSVPSALRGATDVLGLLEDVDLLKIDLDYCDDLLLVQALAMPLRPKVLHVEAQLVFPPDVLLEPRLESAQLQPLEDRALPLIPSLGAYLLATNYTLLHIDPPNLVLVRPDLAHLFPSTLRGPWAAWRDHYFCRADLPSASTQGLFMFGDFEFASFVAGGKTNRKIVEDFVQGISKHMGLGTTYRLSFVGT